MDTAETKRSGGLTPAKMIALGVAITIAIIFGMKFFLSNGSGDSAEESQPAGNSAEIFKEAAQPGANPGYNPALRAEPAGPGDSLEMFTKTNEGYAKEGEEEAAAPAAAAAAPADKKEEAATAALAGIKKAAPAGTVIPKLQPRSFGTSSSAAGKTALPKGGAPGIPDAGAIIKGVVDTEAAKAKRPKMTKTVIRRQ
ncbi:MAG TPA: hypothetical protein PKI19_12735 [Elusimicrobiales bacterium]|nr:hypothetical protein [Elusimicrobiales bacterium]